MMKLFFDPLSPFTRKVRVVALETGLHDRIEHEFADIDSHNKDYMRAHNPLGKVPALILDDGRLVTDSRVICEYLDGLHSGPKLFPTDPEARWIALTQQALGDGIMDALVVVFYETMIRPEEYRWPDWIARQKDKIYTTFALLERQIGELEGDLNIGQITIACAIDIVEFFFTEDEWRPDCPRLAAWFDDFGQRPSMKETPPTPHEG